jgi:DNA-binding XRE family transcriptional regulator
MKAKSFFIEPMRAQVDLENGDKFIFGFPTSMNYQIEQKFNNFFTRCIEGLFEKYYDGDENVIWGPISAGFFRNNLTPFIWVMNDRNKERERIGNRIKEIRKEQGIDAKELAKRAGIDPGNLSRIEQGRFSVGIDILNKIAGALNKKIDFISNETKEYDTLK